MEDTRTNALLERGVKALEALVALLSGQTGANKGGFRAYYTDSAKDGSWVGFLNDEEMALQELEEEQRVKRGAPPTEKDVVLVDNE